MDDLTQNFPKVTGAPSPLRIGAVDAPHANAGAQSPLGPHNILRLLPGGGGNGGGTRPELNPEERAELEAELARLKQEHRDLDNAIEALESMVAGDQLQTQRLKKRKLVLKDRISAIHDLILPDIIA